MIDLMFWVINFYIIHVPVDNNLVTLRRFSRQSSEFQGVPIHLLFTQI